MVLGIPPGAQDNTFDWCVPEKRQLLRAERANTLNAGRCWVQHVLGTAHRAPGMKRIWTYSLLSLVLLLLFAWLYSQHEWLTDGLLSQIKLGMKKDQVEGLLGKPERDYRLPTWKDYDSLWIEDNESKITLIAPENPWLPMLITNGPAIRRERTIHNWIVPPAEPPGKNDPAAKTEWVWIGHKRALILMIDDDGDVLEIRAYSVTKSGGGFFPWLSRKYNDWLQAN